MIGIEMHGTEPTDEHLALDLLLVVRSRAVQQIFKLSPWGGALDFNGFYRTLNQRVGRASDPPIIGGEERDLLQYHLMCLLELLDGFSFGFHPVLDPFDLAAAL